jgi:hypothetical protein
MSLYSKVPVTFGGMELKSSNDMSMRFYSIAGMAERPMLAAVLIPQLLNPLMMVGDC